MVKHLVGIDEVGRGPLAGPLLICAFCVKKDFNQASLRGIGSSKKLTRRRREKWEKILKKLVAANQAEIRFAAVGPAVIDRLGMGRAIRLAVSRALSRLAVSPRRAMVFLDGGLKAPPRFIFQKTVIKGDEKIKIVSGASVLAKVRRDRTMRRLAKIYPAYRFEIHKGYGTKKHLAKIRKHGPCPIHRRSFLGNIWRSG